MSSFFQTHVFIVYWCFFQPQSTLKHHAIHGHPPVKFTHKCPPNPQDPLAEKSKDAGMPQFLLPVLHVKGTRHHQIRVRDTGFFKKLGYGYVNISFIHTCICMYVCRQLLPWTMLIYGLWWSSLYNYYYDILTKKI